MRPPAGPVSRYQRALTGFVKRLHARTLARVLPLLGLRADALTDDQFQKVSAMLQGWRIAANDRDHSALAQAIATDTSQANAREFERVFRVEIPGMQAGLSNQIDDFRSRNVQLITSIETQYLESVTEIVKEYWEGQTRAGSPAGRMSDLDTSNAREAQTLSERLQAEFGVTKRRGDLIARDQVLKLNAQLAAKRQQTAGVTHYVWTTSHDERVRGNPNGKYPESDSDHYRLDGETFAWNEPPIVNTKTGERAHPGEDYQCRCVAVPVMVDLTEGISDDEIANIFDEPTAPAPEPELAPVPRAPATSPARSRSSPREPSPVTLPSPIPHDLTKGGRLPMRQESFAHLRGGGAVTEALPVSVAVYPDGTVFPRDGRHRISLARERGESSIRGNVITVGTRGGEKIQKNVLIPIAETEVVPAFVDAVNALGIENAEFLREGMRDLRDARSYYQRGIPAQVVATTAPPMRVHVEPDGSVHLNDGRHRLTAAEEAGATHINALVRKFDRNGDEVERWTGPISIKSLR